MKNFKTIRFITILLLSVFFQNALLAQCDPNDPNDPNNPDNLSPNLVCKQNAQFFPSPSDEIIVEPMDQIIILSDNCTPTADIQLFITLDENPTTPPTTTTLTFPAGTAGTFIGYVWAIDQAGNTVVCWGSIEIIQGMGCAPDETAPTALCPELVYVSQIAGKDFEITREMIDGQSWDNCTAFEDLEFYISTDLNLTTPPSTTVLNFPAGTNTQITAAVWIVDAAGNTSSCTVDLILETVQLVTGKVFSDQTPDCTLDTLTESALGGFHIRYSLDQGATFDTTQTNAEGEYWIGIKGALTDLDMIVELLLENGISTSCPTSYNVYLPSNTNTTLDFGIQLLSSCDNMQTDISARVVRRCTPIDYDAFYCNHSSYAIDNVELMVNFPPEVSVLNAPFPFTDMGNGSILFEFGSVPSGFCDQFPISVYVDCDVPLGATLCVESSITPYSCLDSLNTWTGSDLRVSGECDEANNLVKFEIKNLGQDMLSAQNYTVVEDVVMSMTQPLQLPSGTSETIELPANGSTWRVEIPQELGHPSASLPSFAIEGCGGYGSMGFINLFSSPDTDPNVAIDCQEVIGAYDPNDKQAFPIGVDEEHFIEPNTSIEYKIRFQNTGNDTAFVVRLEDRISPHLDMASIQAGASSHPYRMELKEDGLLIFHFENILLPDSTTNLEASNGYVQFRIQQLPDNPIGTVIENTADIYFDVNEAVVTNTVHHTIGMNFIETNSINTLLPDLKIEVKPNPFSDHTLFTLEGNDEAHGKFELYDVMGRLVKTDNFTDNLYRLERTGLSSGTYLFRFVNEKGVLANGKVIIQ